MATTRRSIPGSRPDTRARTAMSQGTRRASNALTPRWIIDCVLITSTPPNRSNHVSEHPKPSRGHERLSERASMHQEALPNEGSAEQGCDSAASMQHGEPKMLSQRITRSQNRSLPSTPGVPSRTTGHASSQAQARKRPRRREASTSTDSEEPSAQPSTQRLRHASPPLKARGSSRTSDQASPVLPSTSVSHISRMKPKGKGKGKASDTAYETSLSASASASTEHEYGDARSSSSESRRNVERQRISLPHMSPSFDLDAPVEDGEDDLRSAVEDDFQMLEGPESLPWVPFDPTSKDSEYVPPRVNALMEDMKRTLVLNMSALQKAEHGLSEERERRRELEQEVARLAAANNALRVERSAWASAAAETLAASLENAIVSDIARRLAADVLSNSASPRDSALWPAQIADGPLPGPSLPPSYPSRAPGSGSASRTSARGVAGEADVDVEMADGANPGGGSTARMHGRSRDGSEEPPQPAPGTIVGDPQEEAQ
ncbi:hypothetical protein C8Q80DRAFT_80179 [Daedaleopsis nitida]|nr:hypothetical protein C8Q80DRAFT_80179 [Daedaleopsis nitida]